MQERVICGVSCAQEMCQRDISWRLERVADGLWTGAFIPALQGSGAELAALREVRRRYLHNRFQLHDYNPALSKQLPIHPLLLIESRHDEVLRSPSKAHNITCLLVIRANQAWGTG